MRPLERPKIVLKLELNLPDEEGNNRKFLVNRPLRAKWVEDHKKVSQDILEEIKTYNGTFVGDLVTSLSALVSSENSIKTEEFHRSRDVEKWIVHLLDSLLFSSVKDEAYRELFKCDTIPTEDGDEKFVGRISEKEINDADVDKIMTMLSPRIKHILYLICKNMHLH